MNIGTSWTAESHTTYAFFNQKEITTNRTEVHSIHLNCLRTGRREKEFEMIRNNKQYLLDDFVTPSDLFGKQAIKSQFSDVRKHRIKLSPSLSTKWPVCAELSTSSTQSSSAKEKIKKMLTEEAAEVATQLQLSQVSSIINI